MDTITLPVRRSEEATRVLLVDDDEMMRALGEEALAQAGFDVLTAFDGQNGLALFRAVPCDIVILDIEMPKLDGFELCAQVRQEPGGAFVPIIMMTAHDDHDAIAHAYEVGATDFVPKPVQFSVLTHRLHYMRRATKALASLRDSERRLANAQRIARIGHWEWPVGSESVEISAEARRVFGLPGEEAMLLDELLTIIHPDDRAPFLEALDDTVEHHVPLRVEHRVCVPGASQHRIVYQEGEVGREEATGILRLITTVQDITFRHTAEQRILHLTNYDSVSGLPNQRLITGRLVEAIETAKRAGTRVGVVAIDPDQFKRVNDLVGHRDGDALLRSYAERLGAALRLRPRTTELGADMLGRSGRVGFVAILPDIASAEELDHVSQQLRREISAPFTVRGKSIYVSSSFGMSLFPGDGSNAESLLQAAAIALGDAKSNGRGSIAFYDDSLDAERTRRLVIEGRLRQAIDNDGFTLVFQPKVNTADRGLCGGEALLRWTDAELGFVSPNDFIPVAEDCGLITRIDAWVLRHACAEAVRWNANGLPGARMAVNISAEQFAEPGFVDLVRQTLAHTRLPPGQLELELTERTLMKDSDSSIAILQELRSLGCRIALDDFGTGYSSLSYLTRFPIDTLKIDRAFIVDVHEHNDRAAIVGAIIAMSKSLGIEVIAEGVESAEELKFLEQQRCDAVQGYYFAKPLPGPAFLDWSSLDRAG